MQFSDLIDTNNDTENYTDPTEFYDDNITNMNTNSNNTNNTNNTKTILFSDMASNIRRPLNWNNSIYNAILVTSSIIGLLLFSNYCVHQCPISFGKQFMAALLTILWIFVVTIALYMYTREERIITIKHKDPIKYIVKDTEGSIYTFTNDWFLFHFDSFKLFDNIEEGNTYSIICHGFEDNESNFFKNIISIKLIEKK